MWNKFNDLLKHLTFTISVLTCNLIIEIHPNSLYLKGKKKQKTKKKNNNKENKTKQKQTSFKNKS